MKHRWRGLGRWVGGRPAPVWGLVAVVALMVAGWLVDPYTLATWARMLSLGLLAVSVAVLAGRCGLPSLGQVAPYAVGAYTAAVLARHGVSVGPVQLAAAAAMAGLFSIPVGLAVVRARGITFLMVTLAVGELTAVAAGQWRSVTGGTDGLAGIPATRPVWGIDPMVDDRAVYVYTLAATATVTAVVWRVLRSPAGLLLRGCRDHEAACAPAATPSPDTS